MSAAHLAQPRRTAALMLGLALAAGPQLSFAQRGLTVSPADPSARPPPAVVAAPDEAIIALPAASESAAPAVPPDLAGAVARVEVHGPAVRQLLEQGLVAYRKADFAGAARAFEQAVQATAPAESASRIDALMLLADAYQALGMDNKRLAALQSAQALTAETADPVQAALLRARVGGVYTSFGLPADAKAVLESASQLARSTERPGLAALIWNDLGNAHVALGEYSDAISAFRESHRLGEQIGDASVTARASINLSRALLESSAQKTDVVAALNDAIRATGALPPAHEKAENLLAISDLLRTAQAALSGPSAWRLTAFDLLNQANALAVATGDRRVESYALGYLGRLYEDERRYTEALRYTRQAAFTAQSVDAYESLYRWEWQGARLLRAQGNIADAVSGYRQAIGTLKNVRSDLVGSGNDTFGRLIGPMYFEFADLLLTQTASLDNADAIQANLLEVRNTLEQLKVAEIEDYFEHECVLPETERTQLESVAADSAVIYPVLLPDRTEILVSLPEGLKVFTVEVDAQTITAEVRQFRLSIESDFGDDDYQVRGKRLYDWLVAPFEAELARQRVDTLVFIPDASLRSIPMAALYDGEKFLIEKYAVSTTIGLELTSPRPTPRGDVRVLLAGLSESVQDFPALPAVGAELERISAVYPTARVLKNQDFLLDTAVAEMSDGAYSIVHIASHGSFDRDHRKSFVLTYDDRLTMDRIEGTVGLRRFQDEPLELLVLSACSTAAGDDRAALGLAGVALQAGARSALATLWSVDDVATSQLVSEFYDELLRDSAISKARALQRAQLTLVRDGAHPRLWAPFLLIGNWL